MAVELYWSIPPPHSRLPCFPPTLFPPTMSTVAEVLDMNRCLRTVGEGLETSIDVAVDANDDIADGATPSTFFYGWLMLPLAMLLKIASSPGQTFGFSFFNVNFSRGVRA